MVALSSSPLCSGRFQSIRLPPSLLSSVTIFFSSALWVVILVRRASKSSSGHERKPGGGGCPSRSYCESSEAHEATRCASVVFSHQLLRRAPSFGRRAAAPES